MLSVKQIPLQLYNDIKKKRNLCKLKMNYFHSKKYVNRGEIDASISLLKLLNFSSIQADYSPLACCSRLFSARSNQVERCVLRSLPLLADTGFRFTESHPPRTWQMDFGREFIHPVQPG